MGDLTERFEDVRRQITANDEVILAAVNRRLALVTELWELKRQLGYDTHDADRERRLREHLRHANGGPLSPEGVDRLVAEMIGLTKAELGAA